MNGLVSTTRFCGCPIHSRCQEKQVMVYGKSLSAVAFTRACAVDIVVQKKGLTKVEALLIKPFARQFSTSSESMDKKKSMDLAVQRFIERLSLPDGLSFKLVDCSENANDAMRDEFSRQKGVYEVLQLYHAQTGRDNSESICNTGFRYSYYGNKGIGVYLANHSRYSWNWAGSSLPVLICDVIADDKRISRYRSEVYSPTWNSEYVVADSKLIYPRYILRYEIMGEMSREVVDQAGYVRHGEFGCVSCDSIVFGDRRGIRCDCKLCPTIDLRDVVEAVVALQT